MMFRIVLLLGIFPLCLSAQDSLNIQVNWNLDIKGHHLHIDALPHTLSGGLHCIRISYKVGAPNFSDFYELGNDGFYLNRKNAFKINNRRISGRLEGYDNEGDLRYTVEFRRGKLDGSYVVYETNGIIATKVYAQGRLKSDVVHSKRDKINGK